jgi:hypothetical protein
LQREAAGANIVRSSSAPAPTTRHHSKKRDKRELFVATPEPPRNFYDASSRDQVIEEEEIPDVNKFDATAKANPDRIRSAAITTPTWTRSQREAASVAGRAASDGSWLFDHPDSPTKNTANESKKRISAAAASPADSRFVKRDDKRDTFEWMGLREGDFPTPIPSG